MVAAGRRVLPRGWADLGRQLAIWFGFAILYQLARGIADRNPTKAFSNGRAIVDFETRVTHRLYELTFQNFVDQRHVLATIVSWTYWNSEFTVVGIAVLWVYMRRHDAFVGFRNSILLANMIGLVGYILVPTAPPWMFASYGFVDGVNHSTGALNAFANPYAAMPSLHAADALIVGIFLFRACRYWWSKAIWAAWPAWVWFCVMATANHFWLDVVGGVLVALLALVLLQSHRFLRLFPRLA